MQRFEAFKTFTFELYTDGEGTPSLRQKLPVGSFREAWCEVEALASKSPDINGMIKVFDDKGQLTIASGVGIALKTIEYCSVSDCALRKRVFPIN